MRIKVTALGQFVFDHDTIKSLRLQRGHGIKIEIKGKAMYLAKCNSPFDDCRTLNGYCKTMLMLTASTVARNLAELHNLNFPFFLEVLPHETDTDKGSYYELEISSNQDNFPRSNSKVNRTSITA